MACVRFTLNIQGITVIVMYMEVCDVLCLRTPANCLHAWAVNSLDKQRRACRGVSKERERTGREDCNSLSEKDFSGLRAL